MKSPPPRGSDAPRVHPRPRKRPPRCTLDCGFETSESPALRGFVAERCPITGTSLYLVLKSNGLPRPKIRLKKFGFSSKSVPANIAKKLPPQRCSKLLLIAFSAFLTNGPCSLSRAKAGTHSALLKGIAHSGLHAETGGVSDGGAITTLGAFHTFRKPCVARCQNGKLCRFCALIRCAPEERRKPSEQRCAYARRCSEGVAAPLGCVILVRMLIALLGGPVANFPALWYDKFNKLESVMH